MGLKIVVMGDKILFSCPLKQLNFMTNKLSAEIRKYNTGEIAIDENIKDFYNANDYFLKSPVFRKIYNDYEVQITVPPDKEKGNGISALSQIIPSALMSITALLDTYYTIQHYRSGNTDKETLITSLIMCGIMLLVGILWPIIEVLAEKIRIFVNGKLRIRNYKKYLKRKDKTLEKVITEEKATLEFNNLSLESCQDAIKNRNPYLFSKNIDTSSFLELKFGVGKILSAIKFLYTKPDLIVEDDKLLNGIDDLMTKYKYIENAPFILSLLEYKSLALINSSADYSDYLKSLVLQLVTFHDYKSLKIVVLTDQFSELNKIRNLNHCWSDDKSFRYFATDSKYAEDISSELMKIFNQYNPSDTSVVAVERNTHYLILTDSVEQYKNLKIISYILKKKESKGFSVLMFGSKLTSIPMGCEAFIEYTKEKASFFKSEMDENDVLTFTPNMFDTKIDFDECINLMANIPIKIENDIKGALPDKIGFLEMFNVGKLEQLNILNRWKNSSIVNSLSTPVGVDAVGNILTLDLHEKKHGPHGLIAGMTGSGKSEFIVTYILSLAINYSPDEVKFVLIDYKDGGLAGAFENRKTGIKLPHLVGTITNLDKAEMNRTLVSIKSELQRRQKKFNEAKEMLNTGSIDIYKYQNLVREGSLKEPMSHLFIICDEFAELKAQQPDFMDELVSAARIGRSLGVHLILATQKPSGVVDDQIWSNSKFKVCCRVQTAEDSNEMIRKPDAAYLKESGRFYLQVGYDEYFVLGQSGYSGVKYIPSEKVVSKLDESVSFINEIGEVYKNAVEKEEKEENDIIDYGEELNNILKYIVNIAKENGYQYHQLWLENVPKVLMYNDLMAKYKDVKVEPYNINPLIGEYDNPKKQSQGYVTLPLSTKGNTLIFGATGTGKTTLLSTVIYSTIINHSNKEVNFYIMDFGAEKLRQFSKAPHVGEVLGINDKQKITYLFYMIEAEIEKRKKYYSKTGGDFSMDVKNGKSPFPNIIIAINGVDVFKENFEELYDERFAPISRGCAKYGIIFIGTGLTIAEVSYAVEMNFDNKVVFTLSDPTDYVSYFENPVTPSKNPGRGLIEMDSECVEFQTALVFDEEHAKEKLNYVIQKLNSLFNDKAKPVPTVPRHLSFSEIVPLVDELNKVPLGINSVTAQYSYYDFTQKINLISSSNKNTYNKFIPKFLKILSLYKNKKIMVLNVLDDIAFKPTENMKYYKSNFKKVIPILNKNITKINKDGSDNDYLIVILGYNKLNDHLRKMKADNEEISTLDEIILNSKNDRFKFIIYENSSSYAKILDGKLSDTINNQNGIWLGSDFDEQEIFDCERVYSEIILPSDSAILIKDSIPEYIKYPTIE
ncbi:MAG: type VII secretion protein EssC [Bacilli bacterium]|nr:type VII secretion protein EssC [Bacilli bacterium]